MKRFFALILLIFPLLNELNAQDTIQYIIPGRVNSPNQLKKPYVILISADGFRSDLADKYQAKNLLKFRDQGVNAAYMLASFPSLTFPNHYTIVTGLYPAHHGLVDNSFYDPSRKEFYSLGKKAPCRTVPGMAEPRSGFWQNRKACSQPVRTG